jgi:hypothetical protein
MPMEPSRGVVENRSGGLKPRRKARSSFGPRSDPTAVRMIWAEDPRRTWADVQTNSQVVSTSGLLPHLMLNGSQLGDGRAPPHVSPHRRWEEPVVLAGATPTLRKPLAQMMQSRTIRDTLESFLSRKDDRAALQALLDLSLDRDRICLREYQSAAVPFCAHSAVWKVMSQHIRKCPKRHQLSHLLMDPGLVSGEEYRMLHTVEDRYYWLVISPHARLWQSDPHRLDGIPQAAPMPSAQAVAAWSAEIAALPALLRTTQSQRRAALQKLHPLQQQAIVQCRQGLTLYDVWHQTPAYKAMAYFIGHKTYDGEAPEPQEVPEPKRRKVHQAPRMELDLPTLPWRHVPLHTVVHPLLSLSGPVRVLCRHSAGAAGGPRGESSMSVVENAAENWFLLLRLVLNPGADIIAAQNRVS